MDKLLHSWFTKAQQISPVRIAKFDRNKLMEKIGEHGLKKGAEIGVDRGTFSEHMCKVIPDIELLCVDPWKADQNGDVRYEITKKKLDGHNVTIDRRIGQEAARDVEDESLDFIYIDGDHHFDWVMEDIITWGRKVRIGGVISGHDYYRFRQAGVVDAVDVYTKTHGITEWFLTDEKASTWFWIKKHDPWKIGYANYND